MCIGVSICNLCYLGFIVLLKFEFFMCSCFSTCVLYFQNYLTLIFFLFLVDLPLDASYSAHIFHLNCFFLKNFFFIFVNLFAQRITLSIFSAWSFIEWPVKVTSLSKRGRTCIFTSLWIPRQTLA